MVSACAGCDALQPWAACIVGIGAGLVYILVATLVTKAKIDDPLDAVAGKNCTLCPSAKDFLRYFIEMLRSEINDWDIPKRVLFALHCYFWD